ncbi:MAG: SPOR domain-containing protein, partial [Pseudomonadota bacterium]
QLWAVQLGSFGDQSNAQKLAASLRSDGLPAFISQVESGGKTLHRVRIGPHASRAESEQVVARLAAAEQTARVVKYP